MVVAAFCIAISNSPQVRTVGGLVLARIAVVAGVSVLAVYDVFASIAAGAAGFWTYDADTLVLAGMVLCFVVAAVAGTLHTVMENRRALPQQVAGLDAIPSPRLYVNPFQRDDAAQTGWMNSQENNQPGAWPGGSAHAVDRTHLRPEIPRSFV